MLELEDVRRMIAPFDPQSLALPLGERRSATGRIKRTVQEIAAAAERQKESRRARSNAFGSGSFRGWIAAPQLNLSAAPRLESRSSANPGTAAPSRPATS